MVTKNKFFTFPARLASPASRSTRVERAFLRGITRVEHVFFLRGITRVIADKVLRSEI